MSILTDTQAEKARRDLAAFELKKAADARQAENEKRAASRAALDPLGQLLPDLASNRARLDAIVEAGIEGNRDIVDIARNVLTTISGLQDRFDRRISDTEPIPEPSSAEPILPPPEG